GGASAWKTAVTGYRGLRNSAVLRPACAFFRSSVYSKISDASISRASIGSSLAAKAAMGPGQWIQPGCLPFRNNANNIACHSFLSSGAVFIRSARVVCSTVAPGTNDHNAARRGPTHPSVLYEKSERCVHSVQVLL